MNNILDASEYTCSGCGACNAVCPVNAIQLIRDKYGFFVADVDENVCISCSQCKSVCTRYDETVQGNSLLECSLYALQSAEKTTVKNSSSGGLASELARYGIENGYTVTGVCYDLGAGACVGDFSAEKDTLKAMAEGGLLTARLRKESWNVFRFQRSTRV